MTDFAASPPSHGSSSPDGSSPHSSPQTSPSTPDSEYGPYTASRDVAVIGMACRVAGGNNNPEQLWRSLLEKKDFSGEIPPMRWEPYQRRDVRNQRSLDQATHRGYYLDKLEDFDSSFFGISPKEAEQMDPQQRISLEVAYEALEDSGIASKSLSGSDTAVFWGVNSDDYSRLILEDLPNVDAWMGIGTAYCGVPNRISYHMNLMGPSTAVDAACASGLVSIHHGVQAILSGESKVAIAGGVQAMTAPGMVRVLDKAGAVSPEGRCRSFDDSANGYGRGEGVGAVVLKNINQAIRDGDHILAVVKGTAVAQDGKTSGIMAPNAAAQELVAHRALRVAGIDPIDIRYVECHATSTPLGDPTEVAAVSAVYGPGREALSPCYIGSIKPNIGHLEAGAGTMGFIKAVKTVHEGVLAPQANLKTLNTKINWEATGLEVVRETTKWPSDDNQPRRAAVCSYGYGGTVSHAVIEQFAASAALHDFRGIPDTKHTGPVLLTLSGPQEKRPASQAKTLKAWLESDAGKNQSLEEIASTLALHRDHHDYRAAVVAESHDDAIEKLEALSKGTKNPYVSQSRVLGKDAKKDVVWVFSGHGAQWPAMGKELLENPVFYRAILPLHEIVNTEIGVSPIALLKSGDFSSSDEVQILTYIMQIGISAVLKSYGLYPGAVIGHSVGEIAASVIAGALTPEEGTLVVMRRAVLYRQVMGQGGMILVNHPFKDVAEELKGRTDVVAAIDSSPTSCVVAGTTDAIAQLTTEFEGRSIKVFRVQTDIAFHSPHLEQLVDPLRVVLDQSLAPTPSTPGVKLYSTSLENPRGEALRDVDYWVNNMVNPVRLTPAIRAAAEDEYRVFLEISSHPLVSHSSSETLMDSGIEDFVMVPTLLRNKPSQKSILNSVAQLHCKGIDVKWAALTSNSWADGVPKTTWHHKPAWRKIETGPLNTSQNHEVEKHTLLGQRIKVAGSDTTLHSTRLDNDSKPFPGSHPLHGTEIVPAAGLINTFVKATGANVLKNVILRVPLAINAPRSVQIISQRDEIKLASRLIQDQPSEDNDSSWVTHTQAHWEIDPESSPASEAKIDIEGTKRRIGSQLANDFSIAYLDKVGVSAMGFPWAVTEHYGNTKEMIARVDAAPDVPADGKLPWDAGSWAPVLDAATSVGSTIFFDEPRLRMPAQIERVDIFTRENPPKVAWLYVQEASDTALASHVRVVSEEGDVLAKFTSMRFSEIEGTPGVSGSMESLVHRIAWPPVTLAEEPLPLSHVVVVYDEQALAEEYASTLAPRIRSTLIPAGDDLADKLIPVLNSKDTALVYIPGNVRSVTDVSTSSESFAWRTLDLLKIVVKNSLPSKLFVLTLRTLEAETATALAQGPLVGLCRVLASEHAENFGGLIDTEVTDFPITEMRYVQGADIITVRDGVARTARLRSFPRSMLVPTEEQTQVLPKPEGTYLITGGFGDLGLAVAGFLVEQGARRIVLNSRRALPPRREWDSIDGPLSGVVNTIRNLEAQGASVHVLPLDIGAPGASKALLEGLDALNLPPVRGVVHAAGVVENELALDTTLPAFSRVLGPKISGALALHEAFPPVRGGVDFFTLFSSCGQLVGFTGQSAYATGNSFLDSLAAHRRARGDRGALAFQWTCWRNLGMAADSAFIDAELEARGITDVTREEAFSAWLYRIRYGGDNAVVLRALALEADGGPAPSAILNDIAVRKTADPTSSGPSDGAASKADSALPTNGPELSKYLQGKIKECVGSVLQMASDEVDPAAGLSDLGLDSVMTVSLRRQLQQALKVKVPPTLTWSHPTVGHLVNWFKDSMEKSG